MALELIDNFDQIPLAEASVFTENWQKENVIKAFLFHKNDIECLSQQTDVVGVRFYIGIVANENSTDEPDMIVVGVDSKNRDIIYPPEEASTKTKTEDEVSGVYDFALPCPKLCDPKSCLFDSINCLSDSISTIASSFTTETMRTVQHSTEDECLIELGAITVEDAIERVSIWQCDMNKELVSVYFNIEDLDSIFEYFESANALRVYFGLENGVHRVILIGASNAVEAYYEDVETEYVYVNTVAPCTGNGELSCAVNRTLYRSCSQS
ncbi:hypothetical protein KORDIASMS9_03289 [Kordia sp. SMS9]|uniref:hypothetical protein n=1 Tax=Kordia sp. SMS9 TaxID=2282170 RepID=UPI000E0D1634|nr:hypothetical protein [Kordia sp. SMS9]AXG71034.1 hypothetical protein KORDIASMS9_03289 [Kordia sp. SMS9]